MVILSVALPASSAMCLYSGISLDAAPALQTAIDTPRIALAPSLDLDQPHSFLLPSSSCTILSSICCCSAGLMPTSAGPMIVFVGHGDTLVVSLDAVAQFEGCEAEGGNQGGGCNDGRWLSSFWSPMACDERQLVAASAAATAAILWRLLIEMRRTKQQEQMRPRRFTT